MKLTADYLINTIVDLALAASAPIGLIIWAVGFSEFEENMVYLGTALLFIGFFYLQILEDTSKKSKKRKKRKKKKKK